MTIDFALPLMIGLFLGGIVTELRWVVRLRQFNGQIDLKALAQVDAQGTSVELHSQSLRSLRDHLNIEAGATPAVEPVNVGKRDK